MFRIMTLTGFKDQYLMKLFVINGFSVGFATIFHSLNT